MEDIGTYEERPIPKFRHVFIDLGELWKKVHTTKGLVEVDVTEGRRIIREHRKTTGEELSFTAWIMKCVGQAVSEHKEVHAIRKGKQKLVIFDDVDISVMVERIIRGKPRPMPYVVRKANEKTVKEITAEIRGAQSEKIKDETSVFSSQQEYSRWARWYPSLPKFLRTLPWRKTKDPFFLKKMGGTLGVTSLGMFGKSGGWAIPETPGFYPTYIALGGIARKPGAVGDKIEARDYLSITVLFNHDVVDGAPAARFVARLIQLVENAFGLIQDKT